MLPHEISVPLTLPLHRPGLKTTDPIRLFKTGQTDQQPGHVMSGQDGSEPPEKRARSEEPSSDDRLLLEPVDGRTDVDEESTSWLDDTVMPLSPQSSQLMDQPAVVALSADANEPDADADEPDADANEPAADADEPDANANEPAADADEPAADADEPDADADEPAAGVPTTVVIDPNNLPESDLERPLQKIKEELRSIFDQKQKDPPTVEEMLEILKLVRGLWSKDRTTLLGIRKPLCPLLKALSVDEFLWWFFDTITSTNAWKNDEYVSEHFNRVVNNTFKAFLLVYTFFTEEDTVVQTQKLGNCTQYTIEVNTCKFEDMGPKRKGKTGPKSKGKPGPKSKGKPDWRKVWFQNKFADTERFKSALNRLGLFKDMHDGNWVIDGKLDKLPRWTVNSPRDKKIPEKYRTTTLIFTLPGNSLVDNAAPRFAPGDADADQ